MNQKLFREERLQLITELVKTRRKVHVGELAVQFNVSPSSIRIDLAELESLGLLKRTHGGAIATTEVQGRLVTQKSSLELRQMAHQTEKMAIAQAAVDLIEDGETLMIDGGSTTIHVASQLRDKRGLTIITTAISLLPHLMAIPDARVYVVGGLLDTRFETLVGDITIDTLERFRTSKAILGIDGVSASAGLSVTDPAVAMTKKSMMRHSDQVIIVADHTKLVRVCLFPIASLEESDYLVTDSRASAEIIEALEVAGPQVIVAPVETTEDA
ncbi:MAG: DeoR/GlpR family DNA-binding transcription regulator [Chloroflexota bacterium]|nr:DeoR/GlpR family DNA-binding transcription regulator [Chloroflexota bacterium]